MRNTIKLAALSATAVMALAACSTGNPDSTSSGSGSAGGGSNNKQLAFVQGVAGDEFYITMECGIKAKAAELGYTVTTQGPQKFDPTLQKPIVDSVTASKPAAMLIAPTDVAAMQAP
ncbi:MAG TPA: substrate-binding domain-containing protein, partial [Ornithinibacter sp.]|nr:substrate-binding domain-containing protein [Ornithinibacter sp.]